MDKRSKNRGRTTDTRRVYAPTHGEAGRSSNVDLRGFYTAQPRQKQVYAPTHEENIPDGGEQECREKEELKLPANTRQAAPPGKKKNNGKGKRRNNGAKRSRKKKTEAKKDGGDSLQRTLTFAIIAVVAAGLLITAYFVLQIERIVVTGSSRFSAAEIVKFADVELGSQLWMANEEKITAGIEKASPYLTVESIEKEYPDTLKINVRERQEIAAIAYQNMTVIIDAEGYVLSIGSRADLSGLLLVKGMSASGYTVNQRLGEQTDFYTNTLIDTMEALSKHGILSEIASLDISNPLSINMETVSGVTVHIGQAERLDEKMDALAAVLPELDRMNLTGGTLDLSAKGDPVYSPEKTVQPEVSPALPGTESEPSETPEPTAAPSAEPEEDLPSG